jgi:acetylornithine deacetylase
MKTPPLQDMLTQLVASPSVSSTHTYIDQSNLGVIHLIAEWLDALGFDVDINILPGQSHKANLIARWGEGNDGLVLSGHTDTVPYNEALWQSDPFKLTQRDSKLYGLGSADMKSFFGFVIDAIGQLNLNELTKPLTILATADEESTMAGVKHLVRHNEKLGRYCVIGEPTNLRPIRQHKGIFMESVKLLGQSGHSSDPSLGNNALEGMHEIINTLLNYRDSLASQFINHDFAVPTPTLNLGHIHGGDNPNRICGDCELHFDLRVLPDMQIDIVRNNLREKIQEIATRRNLQCEFSSLFDGTPALCTPVKSEIVKLSEQLTNKKSEAVVFATEGPYFSQMGLETIILGAGNIDVAHQPNEFIEMTQLDQAVNLYRGLIEKVCLH